VELLDPPSLVKKGEEKTPFAWARVSWEENGLVSEKREGGKG